MSRVKHPENLRSQDRKVNSVFIELKTLDNSIRMNENRLRELNGYLAAIDKVLEKFEFVQGMKDSFEKEKLTFEISNAIIDLKEFEERYKDKLNSSFKSSFLAEDSMGTEIQMDKVAGTVKNGKKTDNRDRFNEKEIIRVSKPYTMKTMSSG